MRLGPYKASRSLHLLTRILEVYVEALTWFTHELNPDGLNTLLSLGGVLGSSWTGEGGWRNIPRTVGEEKNL